jgi:hypothetical protein
MAVELGAKNITFSNGTTSRNSSMTDIQDQLDAKNKRIVARGGVIEATGKPKAKRKK